MSLEAGVCGESALKLFFLVSAVMLVSCAFAQDAPMREAGPEKVLVLS
jgi:hypothetical protein